MLGSCSGLTEWAVLLGVMSFRYIFLFFLKFILFLLREHAREQGGARGEERENPKQRLRCQLEPGSGLSPTDCEVVT